MTGRVVLDTTVGRLVVHIYGQGAPTVFWHSLFVDERSWQRLLPYVAADRRQVVITGPGHGDSGDPGRRFTLSECAQASAEVLDALEITEPVDWVGNAWGGHVGVRFAASYPTRVASLVTIGTPIQALGIAERLRTVSLLIVHRWVGPRDFILDAVVETMLSPTTLADDPEAVALVCSSVAAADRRSLRTAVESVSLHRENLAGLLSCVCAPTLVITGEWHQGWTPAQAAAAVKALPDGRVAVVPDAAYLAPLEQPGEVARLVLGFWASYRTGRPGVRA